MLPTVVARLDVRGVAQGADRLLQALDDELERAVDRAGQTSAASSKQTHPFQNRTRVLEGSIEALTPSGRFSDDSLEGGAQATAPYAGYVNARPEFEFMHLGYLLERDTIARDWEDSLERAVRGAGW